MVRAAVSRRHRDPLEAATASVVGVIATILGLFLLAYAVLWITKGRFLKEPFVSYASRYTGRQVSVGGDFQLYLNPHVKFLAEDIAISNPPWARDDQLFEARLVDLELSLLRLIFGQQHFRFLDIDQGDVALEWNSERQNTWTFRESSGEPFELPAIRRAAVTGTTLSYADPALDLELGVRIGDVAARDTRVQDAIRFEGEGTSRDAPFRLSGRLTAPNATIAGGENRLAARVDVGDSRIDVTGTLPGATELEGSDLKLAAQGSNLVTPFTLLGVVIPETRRYRVTSDLTKAGDEWRLTNINGRFGDSDLAGRMTVTLAGTRERLLIDANLRSRTLDIFDAGPWIGYSPAALERTGAVRQVDGRPRVLPDAPLAAERLSRFDARVRYRADNVRTRSIPIANLDLGLDLDDRLLRLDPLDLDVVGGRLTSTIAINARRSPVVTDYDIRLSTVPISRVLTSFDVENSGTTATVRGRVKLRGYGDTVRESLGRSDGRLALVFPRGALWVRNAELVELDIGDFLEAAISDDLKKPVEIRCGLLGFTVRNGYAGADPIFIDTNRNVIRGTGGFSLKDETLGIGIEADAKNFSLFSGQSPIAVRGYFAGPSVDPISEELLTRAGVGLAAAAAVTPLALVAAFIDLGDEEDTDCAPVLRAARAPAVRAADEQAEDDDRG